jgi:hypothetical protein
MRTFRALGLLVVVAVVAGLGVPARGAFYSASCDRFEIDGNGFGSPGGALDLLDDFDDGTLAPNWSVLIGSASEAGTNVTVHDPGLAVQLGSVDFEISTIENAAHDIADGEGDFTARAYWSSGLPATDREFHLQLYAISPVIEAAGLTVNNLSPAVAAAQGAPAGYSVTQSLTRGFGPGFTVVQSDSVSISAGSVTGQIVLRMALDDATNMLTTSFSLDGGATFQSPFTPLQIFTGGVIDYEILLGAAALSVPGPPPPPADQMLPLQVLAVKNPSPFDPTRRRVTYVAKSFAHALVSVGGDPTVGGATLNVQIDSESQCFSMPPSLWTRGSRSYRYSDKLGIYGPVKSALIKQTGSGRLQTKAVITGRNGAVTLVPPNPGTIGNTNFKVGGGGGSYCTTTAGGTIKPNDARTFKAKNPDAVPAYCLVAACSPSGAFVDDAEGAF